MTRWNNLKTTAPATWENIKNTIQSRWNELKSSAPVAWENIKTTISTKWTELKNAVGPAWNDIKTAISNKWGEIKTDALNWGRNIIDGFVDGIKEKISSFSFKDTMANIGRAIQDFIGWKSPTKKGPGRYSDEWAPNLMNMFASGIVDGIPEMEKAMGLAAGSLSRAMRPVMPAMNFESGMGAGTSTLDGPLQINLYLNNSVFGKVIIKSLREAARQGGGLVIPV